MTLKQQINQKLIERLDSGAGSSPETLVFSTPNGHFECLVQEAGRLGCAALRLSWTSDRLQQASYSELSAIAESLSERLTYLLEPIQVIEGDAEASELQMRSAPPTVDEDVTCYYELAVRQGEISLCRWRRKKGQRREQISAQLTLEALGRLAKDMSTA